MESQNKSAKITPEPEISQSARVSNIILRVVALATSFTAAIILGVAKQVTTVEFEVTPLLRLPVPVTAKTSYSSAFEYCVAASAIACIYTLIALVLFVMVNKWKKRGNLVALVISMADVVILVVLFTGNAAAAAIGLVGEKGIDEVHWPKVCNVVPKFCASIVTSLAVNFVACMAYLFIVMIALVEGSKRRV